jgi:hypothetical protein
MWIFFKNIFWFWWNVIGALVTLAVALIGHYFLFKETVNQNVFEIKNDSIGKSLLTKETAILFSFFILILSVCIYLTSLSH